MSENIFADLYNKLLGFFRQAEEEENSKDVARNRLRVVLMQDRTNIYNNKFLEWTIKLLSFVIIISYLLYSVSPSTIAKFNSNYIFLTSIFVIIGIFRYLKLTFVHKLSDSPTNIVYEDKIIKISLILWLFSYWLIIH